MDEEIKKAPSEPTFTNQNQKTTKKGTFWELAKFALIALIIVVPIRYFVAQPFVVSGLSMFPTFNDGQYLIIDELSYKFHPPHRGDVIVFHYPKDRSKYFIKRIIGLPGETVITHDTTVTIKNDEHPEGFVLNEPYVSRAVDGNIFDKLGKDEYFVMGDNRPASSDSRYWGNLPKKLIVGRVYLRLLPFSQIGILPGSDVNY